MVPEVAPLSSSPSDPGSPLPPTPSLSSGLTYSSSPSWGAGPAGGGSGPSCPLSSITLGGGGAHTQSTKQ